MKKAHVGDIVRIKFLDHCMDGEDALHCVVYGRVREITESAYVVQTWDTLDNDSSYNRHTFCIVKSAILKLQVLK